MKSYNENRGCFEDILPSADELFGNQPVRSPAEVMGEVKRSLGMRVPGPLHEH